MIFQTKTISSYRIHSLKYQRSSTLGCKDIGIEKLEFVAKTQFLQSFKIRNSLFSLFLGLVEQVLLILISVLTQILSLAFTDYEETRIVLQEMGFNRPYT